jgi:arylformamidase
VRVVDLTLPFGPHNPRVRFEPLRKIEVDGWNVTAVTFDTHAGTHLDAPCHQLRDGTSLDEMDLSKCVGPALLCDLRGILPRDTIEPDDFAPWAERITPGSRVLYRTDWTERFGQPGYREDFPCPSVECAAWLADRGIVLLGMDTPSLGPVWRSPREVVAVHEPLLRAGVVLVEELGNLGALDGLSSFRIVALPLRLTGGDGSPVRAVALID